MFYWKKNDFCIVLNKENFKELYIILHCFIISFNVLKNVDSFFIIKKTNYNFIEKKKIFLNYKILTNFDLFIETISDIKIKTEAGSDKFRNIEVIGLEVRFSFIDNKWKKLIPSHLKTKTII